MKCSEAIRLRENEAIAARVVAKRLAAADASAAEDVLYRAASLQRFGVKVARRVRSRLRRRKHRRALEAAEKRRVRDGAATKVQACLRGKLNWRAPLPGPEPTVVAEAPAAAPCAESALVRSFSLGDAVLARWENDDLWCAFVTSALSDGGAYTSRLLRYPAVVDKVHADLTYDVTFDDGDFRIKAPYTDVAPSDANDRAVSTREALAVLGEDDDEGGGLVIRRDASDNAWEEAVDDLGRVYFWNTRTGEASWVRPNTMTIQSRRASRPPTPRNVASEELRFDESGSYRYVGYEDTVPTNADGY
ncbi:hypothetical protein M885DRAFT_218679 [Pelagophyceae sp. CCMP2097]|nr:hypothetical protein M885DRAFT_218679 [Pelagophyceae sp. CCMP2097]